MSKNEMFHGVEIHADGRPIDINQVSMPDITHVMLMTPKEPCTNGLGEQINTIELLKDFSRNLEKVVVAVKEGKEPPPTFFVPDLWHISEGSSKLYPKEDGKYLSKIHLFAIRIARQFYHVGLFHTEHHYPGTIFKR